MLPLENVGNNEFLLEFFIYSDNSGNPGTPLVQLTGNVPVTGPGDYTFTPIGSLNMEAYTTYWLVGSTSGQGAYAWDFTTDDSYTSVGGWKFAGPMYDSEDGEWFANPGDYLQLSVTTSSVPEPAVAGLVIGVSLFAFASVGAGTRGAKGGGQQFVTE